MFHTKIPLGSIRVFFHLFSHMFYGFLRGKFLEFSHSEMASDGITINP